MLCPSQIPTSLAKILVKCPRVAGGGGGLESTDTLTLSKIYTLSFTIRIINCIEDAAHAEENYQQKLHNQSDSIV